MDKFGSVVIEGGLFKVVFVLPLAYLFSRDVFEERFWVFRRGAWKWIGALVGIQLVTMLFPPAEPPVSKLYALQAILIGPPAEEVVRTVMMRPLVARWGPFWGIAITSVLIDLIHPSPRLVIIQLFAQSIMLFNTKYSITATASAHALMNAIAVAAGGINWR